ncbi:glucose-1-phosphate thymidylyltransferase [Actinoplanes sp. NPDC049548]|uniref:glucose-1-phosphate thymidylyltransferase n=1 Tax=Actinoplanes sp. NPDC049548 TaxID=3155152 RepID=UPI003434ED3E
MKALVLAGGNGTRLRPFTYSLPKQLVPVANKPILVHCLENIRDIGVSEVGIIVGDQAAQIRAVVGDGSRYGIKVTYIPQAAPLGLAHCVGIARDFLGDDDFVMYLGDNMLVGGMAEAAADFVARRPAAKILVTQVTDPTQYGVAEVDADGVVTALVEKPAQPRSNLAVIGVYFFTPAIHAAVARIKPSRRGELEITDAISDLAAHGGTVTAEEYRGYWKDTGTVADLLDCNRLLLDGVQGLHAGYVDTASTVTGEVIIEPGARVVRSTLTGPIVVAADSVIEDSCLGPHTAVGRNCRVTNAGVQDSILLEGAHVSGVTGINGSLIGRWATVGSAGPAPLHRLLVGDHTQLEVAVA